MFNDPDLSKQWYFDNPGTESWQREGAAIRLVDVWKQYNGNPAIIVAVADGGINQEHPDLPDNLWTNPGEIPKNGIDDDGNGYIEMCIRDSQCAIGDTHPEDFRECFYHRIGDIIGESPEGEAAGD